MVWNFTRLKDPNVDPTFVVVGARTQLEDKTRVAAIGLQARAPANDSRFQANRWCSTGGGP